MKHGKSIGWYWYSFDSVGGVLHTPVFCQHDASGDLYISEAESIDDQFYIGHLDEIDGKLTKWIGKTIDGIQ